MRPDGGTRSALRSPRYVVTSLSGFRTDSRGSGKRSGTSFHVIDTHWNHRLVATYRSEDYRSYGAVRLARERAEGHAEKLNGGVVVPRDARFRPTCPWCGVRGAGGITRCGACGRSVY